MKRLFLLILIVVALLTTGIASAATLNVDNTVTCDDETGTPYCTIQAAVDAAGLGDIINVNDGIYNENVVISEAITLQAASSPIIDCLQTGDGITLNADGVTVDGFEITNCANAITGETSDSVISNNVIHDNLNLLGSAGVGILFWGDNNNNQILGNEIYNNDRQGIFIGFDEDSKISTGNTISGNTIYNNGLYTNPNGPDASVYGIQLWNADNNLIENNEVYNHDDWFPYGGDFDFAQGIYLCGAFDNTINNNNLHDNNYGVGSWACERTPVGTNQVNFNIIAGNTGYGAMNFDSIDINAEYNWWGASDGPSHSPGSGDKVSDNVDFDPWCFFPECDCESSNRGDDVEQCCNHLGGDWEDSLPAGSQCCGDDGNADFGNIIRDVADTDDYFCDIETVQWWDASSNQGIIRATRENDYFHNLGGNPTWYYCDANNDGDDMGPSGIETDNLGILAEDGGSGDHEYICSLWSKYEVFAECCGDESCYSGTGTTPNRCGASSGGHGCRYIAGEILVNNAGDPILDEEENPFCCTPIETWETTEDCFDEYDNDCDGLIDYEDEDCACEYSEWEDDECVADGMMRQTRTELTGYPWCPDEDLEQEVSDPICDCIKTELDRVCVDDGFAEVTYEWNYDYCGVSPFTEIEDDPDCDCIDSEDDRVCISDGYARVSYTWNYNYCPVDYTRREADPNCDCIYTPWTKITCIGINGYALFKRTELSDFSYCRDKDYKFGKHLSCSVVARDKDKDGIPDRNDRCSRTPRGQDVDNNGCSAEQFCNKIRVRSDASKFRCEMQDWKYNEGFKPEDCEVKTSGGRWRKTYKCVAALDAD